MSSPVSIDLRIKLLRDFPELQSDRCPGNIGPDATDTHHTAAQNTSDPFVITSLGTPREPCPEFVVGQFLPHAPETRYDVNPYAHNLNIPLGRKTLRCIWAIRGQKNRGKDEEIVTE